MKQLDLCPICNGPMPDEPSYADKTEDYILPYCAKCSGWLVPNDEHREAQWYAIGYYVGKWTHVPPEADYPQYHAAFELGKQDKNGTD